MVLAAELDMALAAMQAQALDAALIDLELVQAMTGLDLAHA